MEEAHESNLISRQSANSIQAPGEVTIEADGIFRVALDKLGTNKHRIQFKPTDDHKYLAILDVEVNCYSHTKDPKRATIYSYFHETIEDARQDVYSEAVTWLQSEFNLIIDIKASQQLKEAKRKLDMSAAIASIIEEKYTKITTEIAKFNNQKELAMTEMITTAEKLPGILFLAENSTPLGQGCIAYPHMVYMGQDPPTNEKEHLAECF